VAFKQINLYDQADQFKLAELCKWSTNYVWVSNAFWMEYSLIKHGKNQLQEFRDNLIRELTNTGHTVFLDVEDTWHQGLVAINN
jgi:hypothetical protein